MPPKAIARSCGLITGHDPRQLHFEFALWTRDMVADLIEREFGVQLATTTVGRLLRKMGLSPQRPLRRAYEQNPEAVARWKDEEYPAIVAAAKKVGAVVHFGDEASIRSDFHSGTVWAPIGQTSVLSKTGNRESIGMISAITAGGSLKFSTFTGSLTAGGWTWQDGGSDHLRDDGRAVRALPQR
ncbi:winged helix-turn-helix domain-containing protein [Fodinicola feengrottensis]|nr:winged helix-turn-helix domain-containing protein [Fodinicola feengrottensis]